MSRQPLTSRQEACLRYIAAYIVDNGYPPTYREIAAEMGIASTNGVNDHLKALVKKGYVKLGDGRSRAIQIVDLDELDSLAAKLNRLGDSRASVLQVLKRVTKLADAALRGEIVASDDARVAVRVAAAYAAGGMPTDDDFNPSGQDTRALRELRQEGGVA